MAEGAPLLREYTLIGIEGSNPSLSAISFPPLSVITPKNGAFSPIKKNQNRLYLSISPYKVDSFWTPVLVLLNHC